MLAFNTSAKALRKAINIANARHYRGNLVFRGTPKAKGDAIQFTLGVVDSAGPGARVSMKRTKSGKLRRVNRACWHAHGHFFDALFTVSPGARVTSKVSEITKQKGNWQDAELPDFPGTWFSQLCRCHERKGRAPVLIPQKRRKGALTNPSYSLMW